MSTELMGLASSRLACAAGMAPHPTDASGSPPEPDVEPETVVATAPAAEDVLDADAVDADVMDADVVDAEAVSASELGTGDELEPCLVALLEDEHAVVAARTSARATNPAGTTRADILNDPQGDRRKQQHLHQPT